MKSEKTRFALVDCNNFYVSCERVFNPAMEKRPAVVLSNNDGCIVSRSNEVKALGIKNGTPFFKVEALAKKHQIAVFSSNYTLYGDMSRRVMDTLELFTDELEIYSIDEAFLSLAGFERRGLSKYAREIHRTVHQWTGIPVSVGVGETKTLAKIANRIAKKYARTGGVFNVTGHSKIDEILESVSVGEIWGVGRQYAKKLTRYGIQTARQLRDMDDQWVKKHMTVVGLRTVWELRGKSCLPLEEAVPDKKAICCSRSFGEPVTSFESMREAVAEYTARAAEKVRQQQSAASFILVFITTNRFKKNERQYANMLQLRLPVPTSDTLELTSTACRALKRIYRDGFRYKKAGVLLTDLMPAAVRQQSLFVCEEEAARRQDLMHTLDTINRRWGKGAVHLASTGIAKPWAMKRSLKSPDYTTRWKDIPVVKASDSTQ